MLDYLVMKVRLKESEKTTYIKAERFNPGLHQKLAEPVPAYTVQEIVEKTKVPVDRVEIAVKRGEYQTMTVKSKETGEEIVIKAHRFNPEIHVKLDEFEEAAPQEPTEDEKSLDVADSEADAASTSMPSTPQTPSDGDGDGDDSVKLEEMKFTDLKKLASEKGIDFSNTTKKEELIDLIKKAS